MLSPCRFVKVLGLALWMIVPISTDWSSVCSACTVVRYSIDGHLIVARNHDWPFGEGALIVNQRGIEKTSLSPVNPARWVSQHGSVSLTQFGREIPFAGMNELGLTVDLLELPEAKFPRSISDVTSVNVVQWVQYQLDTASTVEEVVASLDSIVPMPMLEAIERVHYFVTDANGDVAVIEFLDGKPAIQRGTEASQCALANSPWMNSAAALGTDTPEASQEQRYLQAVKSINEAPAVATPKTRIDFALSTLDRVAQPNLTQWQLVYEPGERKLWFRTSKAPQQRWIDLDDLSFEPTAPTMILDLDADFSGNAAERLQEYRDEDNQRMVDFAFGRLMPEGFSRATIKMLVLNHAKSLRVAEPEVIPVRDKP